MTKNIEQMVQFEPIHKNLCPMTVLICVHLILLSTSAIDSLQILDFIHLKLIKPAFMHTRYLPKRCWLDLNGRYFEIVSKSNWNSPIIKFFPDENRM